MEGSAKQFHRFVYDLDIIFKSSMLLLLYNNHADNEWDKKRLE